jgi:hypothetical protein
MMDYSSAYDQQGNQHSNTFLDKLLWLLKGFVYPIWSRPYYREAAHKPLGIALLFLLLFAIFQSLFATASVSFNLRQFKDEIEVAYNSGEIPDITIENGIATVSGKGMYSFENNRQLIAVDTTGMTQEINTDLYSEGLLLTRTELHFVSEDGYQILPLTDLNDAFGNPILLNAASMTNLWSKISVIINLIVLGGGFLFYSLGRFIYIVLLGLLVWGVVSINQSGFDFAKILITGIFANVPTTYLIYLLGKIGIGFFGLRGIILFVFWGVALAYILKEDKALEEQLTAFDSE